MGSGGEISAPMKRAVNQRTDLLLSIEPLSITFALRSATTTTGTWNPITDEK